jgi:hypothetical protein
MAENVNEVVVAGGIKTEAKKRPFWVSDEEKKGVSTTPPDNLDVAAAVPDLTWVEKGSVIGAYVRKDGLVIYHIYKADRKEIFDRTHQRMDTVRELGHPAKMAEEQNRIAQEANAALNDVPWWPETGEKLTALFQDHFRHQPNKVTYYPEVDSWSVILPEPNMPGALTKQHLEAPISKLALLVEG